MGKKKYYCDFCDRFFNDDRNTRLKHLNSVGHLRLKKEHYDLFRDPETVLEEESQKKPCFKFHKEGYCAFGGSCSFSHYSKYDLDNLRSEVQQRKAKNESVDLDLNSWLVKRSQSPSDKASKWSHNLPYNLSSISSILPPSLLPFSIKHFVNSEISEWG